MDSYERGRASRIDGHAGPMPVKKVRDSIRDHGTARSCRRVGGNQVPVTAVHLRPVVAHETDVDGSAGAAKTLDFLPGRASAQERYLLGPD